MGIRSFEGRGSRCTLEGDLDPEGELETEISLEIPPILSNQIKETTESPPPIPSFSKSIPSPSISQFSLKLIHLGKVIKVSSRNGHGTLTLPGVK